MTKTKFAIGTALTLLLSATVAHAAVCPPPPNAGNRIFTISAPVQAIGPGGSECYDYGDGNVSNGNSTDDYGTTNGDNTGVGLGGTPIYNDNIASVPLGFTLLDATDATGSMPGLLSVTGLNGDTGTFTIALPSLEGYLLLIKSGTGQLDPDWAEFVLAAGTFGTFDWNISSQGNSHMELWGKTVVPIPAAVWLLGSGLLGLVAIGRRRKGLQGAAA